MQQSDQPSVSHLLWKGPVTFENAAHMFPKFVATIQPIFMIRPELEQPGVSYATHGKKRDTLALNSSEQAESLKRFLCRNRDYAKTCGKKPKKSHHNSVCFFLVYDFFWHAHVGLHTWNWTSDRQN